jgi:3-deoxy-manno-octulosonate cytidylyltransferase (CMP-KDO synthetase)
VPARMGSSRFFGKPLQKLLGKPMILHVLDRAQEAQCFCDIICATDSPDIAKTVQEAGYQAFVTKGFMPTGSDRVAQCAQALNLEYILNVQGDEPAVDPRLLQQMCKELVQWPQGWVTAASALEPGDFNNPNVVKIQVQQNKAVSFARLVSSIPKSQDWLVHRGIYGYTQKKVREFAMLQQSDAEKTLSLEQLRVFPQTSIRVVHSSEKGLSVDVPEDVPKAEALLALKFRGKYD